MKGLEKFIFKKTFFTLKYREIFISHKVLLFLKYDSISTTIVNNLRIYCINNGLTVNLINSKYIDIFLFKNINHNNISWLKHDVIVISFMSLNEFFLISSSSIFCDYMHKIKIIGVSINNYLINFTDMDSLLSLNNNNIYVDLYIIIKLIIMTIITILYYILYNLIHLFEILFFYLNKP